LKKQKFLHRNYRFLAVKIGTFDADYLHTPVNRVSRITTLHGVEASFR